MCSALLAACSHAGGASLVPSEAANIVTSSGYRPIYSFGQAGKFNDGRGPVANVIAVGGKLYGTTQFGGTTNAKCNLGCGTVFSVTTSGIEARGLPLHRRKGRCAAHGRFSRSSTARFSERRAVEARAMRARAAAARSSR